MRSNSAYALSPISYHKVRSLSDSTCSIYNIINKDNILTFYISDDTHLCHLISLSTMLVANNHRNAKILSIAVGTLNATNIRSSHHSIFHINRFLQIINEDSRSIQMVHRHIEETLYLVCVQVHCNQAANTCSAEHVCDELSADRYTWLILAVLTSPTEVRDYSSDIVCRCTLSCINHQEKLHQIIRCWVG